MAPHLVRGLERLQRHKDTFISSHTHTHTHTHTCRRTRAPAPPHRPYKHTHTHTRARARARTQNTHTHTHTTYTHTHTHTVFVCTLVKLYFTCYTTLSAYSHIILPSLQNQADTVPFCDVLPLSWIFCLFLAGAPFCGSFTFSCCFLFSAVFFLSSKRVM